MFLVCEINSQIEIWGDEHNFIVRFKDQNGKYQDKKNWYFPNLAMALDELLDYLVKKGVKNTEKKELEDLKEVVWKTKEELWSVARDLKPPVSGSERKRGVSQA